MNNKNNRSDKICKSKKQAIREEMIMMFAIDRQGHRTLSRLAALMCSLKFFDFPADCETRVLKSEAMTGSVGSLEV